MIAKKQEKSMRTFYRVFSWLIIFLTATAFSQEVPFSADSAYSYVEHLTVTIGPRVMGSPNERQALQWASDKFTAFGAATAYIMPVQKAPQGINTNSGVAVGTFPGQSDSIIVIGAHIDSDRRDNPGASDNASGTACIVELARNWSQQPRRYSLVFAAFGGEEGDLVGSEHFVEYFPDMDRVTLMLNIDMAGSEGWLIPFIDVESHQAPKWLVEDAYAFDRSLGYNDLEYPTHFFSLNSSLGDGAGSDHMPFMKKDIPAIDFTSGINIDPIHTPQDRLEFLSKPMLARSGLLVSELIAKYNTQGIPAERKGHYMMWEVFGGRVYIPTWFIITVNFVALLLGILALRQTRKHRLEIEKSRRARVSGLKLLVLIIIIAIFAQLGEALMQFIKGVRYPWYSHVNLYLWFAAIWALAGVWVASQLTRTWRFSRDPYIYAKRAIILLIFFTIGFWLAGPRLALYPALTLLIFAIVINIPGSILKMFFTLIAPLPMFRLLFMETVPMFARTYMMGGFFINDFLRSFLYSGAITFLLVLWFLPVLFIFAYTPASVPASRNLALLFRKPLTGLAILMVIAAYGGYLYSFPAYTEKWQKQILLDVEYDQQREESEVFLKGNEFLRGVSVKADTFQQNFNEETVKEELPLKFRADWITVTGIETVAAGEKDTVSLNWQIASSRSWSRADLYLSLDSLKIDSIKTELNHTFSKEAVFLRWTAEPPDTLNVSATLIIPPGRKLVRKVVGVYPQVPLPIDVSGENANVAYRTTVTDLDTLQISPGNESFD
jgi:hypothetical protein